MKLFVAGLPYDLDDAELEEIFEKFGKVVSAKVAMDKDTGKSKGFGFVEMANDSDGREQAVPGERERTEIRHHRIHIDIDAEESHEGEGAHRDSC